ncbi:hypothetical protein [Desulfosporosinus sp. SB140]|uniref:hypothetical protein n=1 Tax=Desulfosporosinus paludis TaxID=3115649 RepID=UPI00388D4449
MTELGLKPRRSGSGGTSEVHGIRLLDIPDEASEVNQANADAAARNYGSMILSPGPGNSEEDVSIDDL